MPHAPGAPERMTDDTELWPRGWADGSIEGRTGRTVVLILAFCAGAALACAALYVSLALVLFAVEPKDHVRVGLVGGAGALAFMLGWACARWSLTLRGTRLRTIALVTVVGGLAIGLPPGGEGLNLHTVRISELAR